MVQALIKSYSSSLHSDTANPEAHIPSNDDDEVEEIHAISVKFCWLQAC